jgi:hypothetical protein
MSSTPSKKQLWWHGCSIDELEQPDTYNGRHETMLVAEVFETLSTHPSTTVATPAKLVSGRRRQNKQRKSHKPITRRPIDWKLVDFFF